MINRTTPAQYRKVGRRGTGKKRGQREKDRKERGRREIREREKENACTVQEGGESNRLHSAGKLVRRGKRTKRDLAAVARTGKKETIGGKKDKGGGARRRKG